MNVYTALATLITEANFSLSSFISEGADQDTLNYHNDLAQALACIETYLNENEGTLQAIDIEVTLESPLPIYTMDIDQPITCGKCGGRTDNVAAISDTELHEKCLNCEYEFIAILE